jgi:protein AroM
MKEPVFVQPTIGLVTIGQAPRADLSAPLRALCPDLTIVEAGALDQLSLEETSALPDGDYPLNTRMRDGSAVTVDRAALEPLLQRAIDSLEGRGAMATMLMCAGTFTDLRSNRPLFSPFSLAVETLRATGLTRIGIICPFVEQEHAIERRWRNAGFDILIQTAVLAEFPKMDSLIEKWTRPKQGAVGPAVGAIVLDYVGHDPAQVIQLQRNCTVPVFDLGYLTMHVLASSLSGRC